MFASRLRHASVPQLSSSLLSISQLFLSLTVTKYYKDNQTNNTKYSSINLLVSRHPTVCGCKYLTTNGSPGKKGGGYVLNCSVCQFPWYKCSRHGQDQPSNTTYLNMDLERQQHSAMQHFHHIDTRDLKNLKSIDNSNMYYKTRKGGISSIYYLCY